MDEQEILKNLKNGQEDAFPALVKLYEKEVYTLSLRILGHREDARDASQEAWLKVYRGLRKFRGESTLKTWIYRIAINVSLSELKKKHQRPVLPLDEEVLQDFPTDYGEVENALLNLSAKYRSVIALKDIYGYSYEEIAGMMNITVGLSRVLVHRGRIKLKTQLQPIEKVEEKNGFR